MANGVEDKPEQLVRQPTVKDLPHLATFCLVHEKQTDLALGSDDGAETPNLKEPADEPQKDFPNITKIEKIMGPGWALVDEPES